MQILSMSSQKGGKWKICLEDGTRFALYKKEIQTYQLEEGGEISPQTWQEICTEILQKRARKRALFLLERMDRTEYQLRKKLRENLYPEMIVEDAVAYVKSYRYIDDVRYAQNYIRCSQESKSRLQMKQKLLERGVSAADIACAMQEAYSCGEEVLIRKLLEKKHYDPEEMDRKEKYKIYQYLMRRGFSGEMVRRCMELN